MVQRLYPSTSIQIDVLIVMFWVFHDEIDLLTSFDLDNIVFHDIFSHAVTPQITTGKTYT